MKVFGAFWIIYGVVNRVLEVDRPDFFIISFTTACGITIGLSIAQVYYNYGHNGLYWNT